MKRRNGFSLIEVLIVVVIAAALVVVVSNFSTNTSSLNGLITDELQAKSDISQTLEIMTGEIQSAQTSADGAYPIDFASTSSLAFYDDINNNGTIEHIRYFLSSSTIYRGVINPTGTPATYPTSTEIVTDEIDNVSVTTSTPLFSYYGASYTGTQSPLSSPIAVSSIRLVQVAFTSEINKNPSQPSVPEYFSTFVDIRNLDSN